MAPYLALPYAACEGLAIGGISAMLERRYPGIAIQAVALTFGVLASMLLAYKTRTDPSHAALPRHRGRRVPARSRCSIWCRLVLGFFHVQTCRSCTARAR